MQIISKHDYQIIMACKCDDDMQSLINYLCNYLGLEEIDEGMLYQNLVNVLFDIYGQQEIKHILTDEIPKLYQIIYSKGRSGIETSDWIKLFYYQFMLLDILEHIETTIDGNKAIIVKDLYSVYDNGTTIPFSEYHCYLNKNEEKNVIKKKLN